MEREEILRVLPQRGEMLLVDDILEIRPMEYAVGCRYVREDEFWTKGHFPGEPVMPGVLLIEHMAQVALFIVRYPEPEYTGNPLLVSLERVKFLRSVFPGMELVTRVRLTASVDDIRKAEAEVYIGREMRTLAAKCKMTVKA